MNTAYRYLYSNRMSVEKSRGRLKINFLKKKLEKRTFYCLARLSVV